jgi:hypothetical protein
MVYRIARCPVLGYQLQTRIQYDTSVMPLVFYALSYGYLYRIALLFGFISCVTGRL